MANLSDEIAGEITAQTVNVVRAAAGIGAPILVALRDLEKELLAALEDVVGKTDFTVGRLRALLAQTKATIAHAFDGIAVANKDGMVQVAGIAARQALGAVNAAVGAKLTSVEWSREQLAAIAHKTVVRGDFYEEWWKKQGLDLQTRFERQMRLGQLRGETVDQLARRVRGRRELGYKDGIMQVTRNQAQALVRTSALGVSNAARLAAYADNDDVIKGVQWVSTLDSRTTPQCIALDGKRWDFPKGDGAADYVDYKPVGHDKRFEPPPIHWNCRSTVIPITYSWKELAGEHGNSKMAQAADRVPRETRASMDGQVARTTTFSEWLATKPREFQDEVLGAARAQAWRDGKLSLTGLTDQNNNPLTLAQLGIPRARLEPKLPIPPETPSPAPGPGPKEETPSGPPPAPAELAKMQAAVDSAARKLAEAQAKLPPSAAGKAARATLDPAYLDKYFATFKDPNQLLREAGALVRDAKNDAEVRIIRAALIKREAELKAAATKPPTESPKPKTKPITSKPELEKKDVKEAKRNHAGGIEESWRVTFTDGSRAIFKPISDWRNEVAASDIADMLGLSDLVPATIEKTMSVGTRLVGYEKGFDPAKAVAKYEPLAPRVGSLQAFVEGGKEAGNFGGGELRWAFDGPKDAARAAAFDYLIGNMDRHHFNWMVRDGKLQLIDHSRAVNYDSYSFRSNLVRWAQGKSTILGVEGEALPIPAEVAGWLAKWPEIEQYLHKQYGAGMPQPLIDKMKERLEEMVKVGARQASNTFASLMQRFRE